jgi:hypothetical protein
MKILYCGLSLLALITAFCIGNYIYTIRCLENILAALDAIEEDVLVLDWESAHARSTDLIREWERVESYFMAVLWHQHVDDVAVALNQIRSDIEMRDLEDSEDSIIEAKTIMGDIIEMETVSIGSIF